MDFWASTNNPLPSGPIPPSRCSTTSSSTLYILLGDSIDRELVRSRCAAPVAYNARHCAKCVLCAANPCETWLNVMLFGLGLYSCEHKDKNWAPQEESQSIQPRVEALLGAVLHSPAASTYNRIVVSLHSGAWDVLATKECPNISTALLAPQATNYIWRRVAENSLLSAARSVVSASPVARRVQLPLLWRTMPFICRSFANGEDASELLSAASALGADLACRHGLTLVDWRGLSCRAFNQSLMLADNIHWHPLAYNLMASELTRRAAEAAALHAGAAAPSTCTPPPTPRCECHQCKTNAAWTWRLHRRPAGALPCGPHDRSQQHRPRSDAASEDMDWEDMIGRYASSPPQQPRPRAGTCAVHGPIDWKGAAIALFSLAAYPTLGTPPWMAMTALGWRSNAKMVDVYVVAKAPLPAAWSGSGNVVSLVVGDLIETLLRFAGIPTSANGTAAGNPRPPRPASFSPLLADFAATVCQVDLGGYSYFGSIELDIVLGDLRPFIGGYIDSSTYDAIAMRWAPPNRRSWKSVDDAVGYNTLGDVDAGVPFSTPLLLLRNTRSMRTLWWKAELWLRGQERPGAYSLLRSATCERCTGPVYWFDEHNYPNFWRNQSEGAAALQGTGTPLRVVYACCGFDDHHVGVGSAFLGASSASASAAANGCVVEWSKGVITRSCESASRYVWDDVLSHPPPAWNFLKGREGCGNVSGAAGTFWFGSAACAALPRHATAASSSSSRPCTEPAPSFGYDVGWTSTPPSSALTVEVLGGGDSAAAVLAAAGGRCRGVRVTRTLAAFHAARSKQLPIKHSPSAEETVELHPRFLHRR